MSWSVSATGKGDSLKAELAKQFDQAEANTAGIPEEKLIVQAVREAALGAVDTMPSGCEVNANGSVYGVTNVDDGEGGTKRVFGGGSLSVTISQKNIVS